MTKSTENDLIIGPGDPDEDSLVRLFRLSEDYSRSLYPPESVHTLPQSQLKSSSVRLLVARRGPAGRAVGCGALLLQPNGCAELKRMFVDPALRGQRIGARLLTALESLARAEGVHTLRLETGIRQHEAVSMYRRFGYRERGPFDAYEPDPLSIFMEKHLNAADPPRDTEPGHGLEHSSS